MGFKYVLIPASLNDAMKEFTYEGNCTLENDTWKKTVVSDLFSRVDAKVDKDVIISSLKKRTGNQLPFDVNEIQMEDFTRIAKTVDIDIFPVSLPHKTTGYLCVSVYLHSKGFQKSLEINKRASDLVFACGHLLEDFRGDAFFSRYYDDEDKWERLDFTLADCNSDARWVKDCKEHNAKKVSLEKAAKKLGIKDNAVKIHSPSLQNMKKMPEGETEAYKWIQTMDEVEITFKGGSLQKCDMKLMEIILNPKDIKVDVKGKVLLQGNLEHAIIPDLSAWTLSDGVLQVTLAKHCEDKAWDKLMQDLPLPNISNSSSDPGMFLLNQGNPPSIDSNPDEPSKFLIPDLFVLAFITLALIGLKKFCGSQKPVLKSEEPLVHT